MLQLVSKNIKWKCGSEQNDAFERVKGLFQTNLQLFHPQQGRKYVMYTDASEYAIGAVLHQEDEQGSLHVVAYANRTLKGAELHYCTSEKEILAIINACLLYTSRCV